MNRAIVIVLGVTVARLLVAAFHPVAEDEAYYWTWSLHPAFGYVDHPPMVAWLIASTSFVAPSPLAIRFAFVICEAIAALAAGATAWELSGAERSAWIATVLVLFIPNVKLMIGEALPDPPFLMFWALSLMYAVRGMRTRRTLDFALLGLALGGAILTRVFGWALFFGVMAALLTYRQDARVRAYALLAGAIALTISAPWIAWNATHGWANLLFTVRDRQVFRSVSATHAFNNMTVRFLLYDATFVLIAYTFTVRKRYPLLAWTALPFPLALAILAFPQTVEAYWLMGPAISLFVSLGVAARSTRSWWTNAAIGAWVVAGAASFVVVAFAALPESAQAAMLRNPAVSGSAYSPAYAYRNIAQDVGRLAATRDATILSDRYEVTSQFELFGVPATIVDDVPQRKQWRLWNPGAGIPQRAIYVSTQPLSENPALAQRLMQVYANVQPGAPRDYAFAGRPAFRFYVTWLDAPLAGATAAELFGR